MAHLYVYTLSLYKETLIGERMPDSDSKSWCEKEIGSTHLVQGPCILEDFCPMYSTIILLIQ